MASNRLCELVGIEYPIFQGGMAWVANASLASAVSNAGGLGIIAAMNSNADQLRAEISKCRALTEKPFGVNVMLMSPFPMRSRRSSPKSVFPWSRPAQATPPNTWKAGWQRTSR